MAYSDLREFLAAAEAVGDVQTIRGADWNLEIGCITELVTEQEGRLLLFQDIPGFPEGFRIATNFLGTPRRFALALDLPHDLSKVEMVKAWKERARQLKPHPPAEVPSGPLLENAMTGDEVDLEKFPTPQWHEFDGGRYIGTADMVVMRHPESGWINVGTYRACLKGSNRVSLWMIDAHHGRGIAETYWQAGRACPVALVLGCEPATWMAAPSAAKAGVSEYDYAGALRKAPVEVIRGPSTGLPVPATSEIVLEGEIPPIEEESVHEGPFGEWPGYYTHTGDECVVRVERVMYRNDPILLGNPPLLPITPRYGIPLFAARIWEHLENSGVGNIRGVWCHCHTLMIVISIEQNSAAHAMETLRAAAALRTGASMYRYYVVVDEDIDPSDLNTVLWAMCTRADPAESAHIMASWTSDIDPRLSPEKREKRDYTAGRLLIDACKPYSWRADFPRANRFSKEMRKRVREKWLRGR